MIWKGLQLPFRIGVAAFTALFSMTGCMQRPGEEGNPAIKVFLALGISLAAIFLVFYIVVKGREKD